MSDISVLSGLKALKNLDLSDTNVSDISALSGLKALTNLDLSCTKVNDISALRGLTALKNLDLRYLNLNDIPEWLLDLELDFLPEEQPKKRGIHIKGLRLKNQPIEIFHQSIEVIRAYFKSQERVPVNECKVIFLGDGGAGKSLIIDRMMNNGEKSSNFEGEATPGIKISSKKYQVNDDEIELHFWDFGGQAIMHSMHRLFLTNRTLYVVVTNARDNKANDQAWYWIRNIKNFANGAPVFLLINQKDQNPSANINETGLRKEYPDIKGVEIVSALNDTPEEFNKSIPDVICKIVSEMESVHTPFAKPWLALMNNLQEMPENYIDSKTFRSKCRDKGIDLQPELLDQIVNWFKDLGVCFYSRKHPSTRNYMVLKPRWILNAIYILSFNGRKYAKKGIIKEEDVYKLICEPVPDREVKKVSPDIKYEENEILYIINVLLNFSLVHRIDNERFFVPMLCDENESDIIDKFDSEEAIHISFRYGYLPENVLHSLMVMHGEELNTEFVWKTGALLERKRCGWQALVRSKDDCLDVYAKASDQGTHPINSFLDIIRESVYKINAGFGLEADEFITYFRDGEKEEIDYLWLEEMRNNGIKEYYSRVFHSRLNIDEIIGVITSPNLLKRRHEDEQMQVLLDAIEDALLKLQRNPSYISRTENECNSYVRDILETVRYVCKDQTLQGVGKTGRGDGELDILIRDKDRGDDIAIFEALKLDQKSFAKGDQEYLTAHLQKLLDNYNPNGLTNLLLVSYVSWDKNQFDRLAAKYMEYISNNSTTPYEILECRTMDHLSASFLRCYRAEYDCGGIRMYVYHIVVRIAQ